MKFESLLQQMDKFAHFGGGAGASSIVTSLGLILLAWLRWPLAIAPAAGVLAAFAANRWIERRQAKKNAEAEAAGLPPPHQISVKDWQVGTWGGVAVALPVFVLQALAFINR